MSWVTFPGNVDSVTQARRLVTEILAECPDDVRDVVEMLVSELATNSVRHTTSDFSVRVAVGVDRIRVEVSDRGAGRPEVRSPTPSEPNGRGLQIVGLLADEWGVSDLDDGSGKTVWFEVSPDKSLRT
jgi:anti-sigma regulatory factor (Ser/Thr protein kinase)